MKRQEHVKLVINGLMSIRTNYRLADGYSEAVRAADAIFGSPNACLWCKSPHIAVQSRVCDLDRHFCADCCPICNGWPDERD